jgi:hypothetical protein
MGKRGAGYGSEDHLQRMLASDPATLNAAILREIGSAADEWLPGRSGTAAAREWQGVHCSTMIRINDVRRAGASAGRHPASTDAIESSQPTAQWNGCWSRPGPPGAQVRQSVQAGASSSSSRHSLRPGWPWRPGRPRLAQRLLPVLQPPAALHFLNHGIPAAGLGVLRRRSIRPAAAARKPRRRAPGARRAQQAGWLAADNPCRGGFMRFSCRCRRPEDRLAAC